MEEVGFDASLFPLEFLTNQQIFTVIQSCKYYDLPVSIMALQEGKEENFPFAAFPHDSCVFLQNQLLNFGFNLKSQGNYRAFKKEAGNTQRSPTKHDGTPQGRSRPGLEVSAAVD